MGLRTDATIKAFQEQTGIEPATGRIAENLAKMSQAAYELIMIIEYERSGIRDGDGGWHGADPMDYRMREIVDLIEERRSLLLKAWEDRSALKTTVDAVPDRLMSDIRDDARKAEEQRAAGAAGESL